MPAETKDQEALDGLEAYRVNFGGLGRLDGVGEQPPEIDDEVIYIVRTRCTGAGRKRMKDGEMRTLRDMEVLSVEPQGPPKRPDGTPAPPTLFGVPNADDTGTDEEDVDQDDDEGRD